MLTALKEEDAQNAVSQDLNKFVNDYTRTLKDLEHELDPATCASWEISLDPIVVDKTPFEKVLFPSLCTSVNFCL